MKWTWIAGGLVVLAVITGVSFAVRHYNRTIEANAQLRIALSAAQGENSILKAYYDSVTAAANTIDRDTKTLVERTNTLREKVKKVPVTSTCVDSPAIGVLLDDYNSRLRPGSEASGQPSPATQ